MNLQMLPSHFPDPHVAVARDQMCLFAKQTTFYLVFLLISFRFVSEVIDFVIYSNCTAKTEKYRLSKGVSYSPHYDYEMKRMCRALYKCSYV